MKKEYQAYMDAVEASPELHRRLMGLSVPRRANRWQRYGSLAAALVVLIGAAAFGLSRLGADRMPGGGKEGTVGGYTVQEEGEEAYVELPFIAYGEDMTGGKMMDIAYNAPAGSVEREITGEDVLTLMGGETALETHLDWEDFTWSGQGVFLEDGSLWHLYLWGESAELVLFLDLLVGDTVPPGCILTEGDTVTDVMGVQVKGYTGGIYGKADEETGETILWLPESRTVEFAANGAGYRFQVYGPEGDGERVEELVSRFVRLAIADGLNLAMA